jgi:hypothetical protein
LEQRIVEGGKIVNVGVVKRGALLVYDEREWQRRAMREYRKTEWAFALPMVMTVQLSPSPTVMSKE